MTDSSTRLGTAHDLLPYLDLARALARDEMSVPAFEAAFLALFRRQDFLLPTEVSPVMQALFFAVEDYIEDDGLREPGELDAGGLRRRVAEIELRLAQVLDRLPR